MQQQLRRRQQQPCPRRRLEVRQPKQLLQVQRRQAQQPVRA
jgi:hypothetical protein